MSMIRCERCPTIIDSDDDPDCFVEIGNMRRLHKEIVLCAACRQRREDQIGGNEPEGLAGPITRGSSIIGAGRVVCRYAGVQIRDAREHLYVEFAADPKPGVSRALREAGFRKHPDKHLYSGASNAARILNVQAILRDHYGSDAQ